MGYGDELGGRSEWGQLLLWLLPVPSLGLFFTFSDGANGDLGTLYELSMTGFVCGAIVLASVFGASAVAGQNRERLATIFGPSMRIMLAALAVSIACQAALLVIAIFELESSLFGRVHAGLLLALSLGAVVACFTLLSASFRFLKSRPSLVRASILQEGDQPDLWSIVRVTSSRLGSIVPDQIVVGLDPTFYVTSNDVKLLGHNINLRGNTLYVSAPLMRVLSKAEFTAVVGHELGHFRGNDLAYSARFAPTYSRLGEALHALYTETTNASDMAKLPAIAAISTSLNRFAVAERAISRSREFSADEAGAEAASGMDLAMALFKVSAFADYWNHVIRWNVEEIGTGSRYTNLSILFASTCERSLTEVDWATSRDALFANQQPHPIDTHPPLAQRVSALQVNAEMLKLDAAAIPADAAINLVHQNAETEELLSILEASWLQAIGAAQPPRSESSLDQVNSEV